MQRHKTMIASTSPSRQELLPTQASLPNTAPASVPASLSARRVGEVVPGGRSGYRLQETVIDPLYRCVTWISPGTPGTANEPEPNQCGALTAGPPLHRSSVPAFTFESVVVPVTVTGPETVPFLESQPATIRPTSNAKPATSQKATKLCRRSSMVAR